MPATFLDTGGLVVTRAGDDVGSFVIANRHGHWLASLRPQQLIDSFHFLQRHRMAVSGHNGYSADLQRWDHDFRYQAGAIQQRCLTCKWVSQNLQAEHHRCPNCSAPHASIEADLILDGARFQSRKLNNHGFYLYPFGDENITPVTIYEPDLDQLLPMLDSVTGLAQMRDRSRMYMEQYVSETSARQHESRGTSCQEQPPVTRHLHGQGRRAGAGNSFIGEKQRRPRDAWEQRLVNWFSDHCSRADEAFPILFNYHAIATMPLAVAGMLGYWATDSREWLLGIIPYALPWMLMFGAGFLTLMISPYFLTFTYLSNHGIDRSASRLIAFLTHAGSAALFLIYMAWRS